ncbi:suppressor of SWI4 1 homolog [Rhopilema esculentum]|uniref:suppressor of SWI4 1 homolog n=1 Tax=Rhopilema esculentum TaxID=499914 RepID=UPI0031E32842
MGKGKKKKKQPQGSVEEIDSSVPRSFVMHRGDVGKSVLQLETDMKRVMEPYTALNLKVRKNNVLKDFVHVAGPLGVSHFLILSKTETSTNFRIARLPRGPTLTFQVQEYSLMKDVAAIVKKPKTVGKQYNYPPLLVLNHFNADTTEMKLMTTMLQNMFPSINVRKVKLSEIRRCVLFNYNEDTKTIDFRHYNIDAVPVGLSRGVKKLMKNRIPDLGSLTDISEFVTGSCYMSESEGEEPVESQVVLPQNVHGRGNVKASQSAIKLTELGPRLTLQLVKVEEGICDGEVLFHQFVHKTEKEKEELRTRKRERKVLKEKRKKEQEENIKRKEVERQKNKEKSLAGMEKKRKSEGGGKDDSESDDDTEYFRQEVGEEPDEDLFSKPAKKGTKRKFSTDRKPFKKRRMDGETSAKTASKRKFPFKSNDRSSDKRQTKAKKFPIKRTSTGKFKGKGRVLGKKAAKR